MGNERPYEQQFGVGTRVEIRDEAYLREFRQNWKLHHSLVSEQFGYAGQKAVVGQVTFYHGGDELYLLVGIPGVWHRECLLPAEGEREAERPVPVVLLPGLDGTADLFDHLLATTPSSFQPVKVCLPLLSEYDGLFESIVSQLPSTKFVLVAESFSGPIAARIAAFAPERVRALVLCNSFLTRPVKSLLRFLPWSWLLSFPTPEWVVRHFLLSREASRELVTSVRLAIGKAPARVLAGRIRAVLSLPASCASPPIATQVLVLLGTQDRLLNISEQSVKKAIPHAVVKRLRAPHLLLQAAPDAAWAEISAFLARAG